MVSHSAVVHAVTQSSAGLQWPMTGRGPGHVTTLDQWEASIQITWPLSTNERPASRSRDHSGPSRLQHCSEWHAELRYWEMTGQYFIQCINSALAANKSSTLDMFTCPHALTSLIRDTWRRSVLFIILLNNIVLSSFIVYCLPVTLHNC